MKLQETMCSAPSPINISIFMNLHETYNILSIKLAKFNLSILTTLRATITEQRYMNYILLQYENEIIMKTNKCRSQTPNLTILTQIIY